MTGLAQVIGLAQGIERDRPAGSNRLAWIQGLPGLGLIWLIGAVVDRVWFAVDRTVPAWDQSDYLALAMTYWQALQTPQWFSIEWWVGFWQLSTKMPPLTFIATAPFLTLFGFGIDSSTLVNLLFSGILLGSVYTLGACLFTVPVGLWAAGLCFFMPALYGVRLDYLIDYPLTALVMLSFACLTLWRRGDRATYSHTETQNSKLKTQNSIASWLTASLLGLSLGLALMTKQTALFFLVVPIAWVGVSSLWHRAWGRLAQLGLAIGLAVGIMLPWYRTNWLLILTASKRATIDSAIAEGDPSLLSLDAWTYYLKALPEMVSPPLLIVPLLGVLLFWRRSRVSSLWKGALDYDPKTKEYRDQAFAASRRSLLWLLLFWLGGYLLSSLNINKDDRYVVPYLPVVALFLAYGFSLLPKQWRWLKWGTIGLVLALTLFDLSPVPENRAPIAAGFAVRHPAYTGAAYPHAEIVAEVAQSEPYLRSTIGVLPSTAEINQHNLQYYGMLQQFQVFGRQVGENAKQREQDQRSLPWLLTKTGNQGSIRKREAQTALTEAIAQNPDLTLHKTWPLPDRSLLNLYRWRIPRLEVSPIVGATRESLQLIQVIVPEQAPPGQPIPVTYKWAGSWSTLRSGLVLLTWRKQGEAAGDRWLHDHGLADGRLRLNPPTVVTPFELVERLAMLPPVNTAPGLYFLEATYLDRRTGESRPIVVPPTRLQIVPTAAPTPAPELDWLTQLRSLATIMPQGLNALDRISTEVGRINQYAPEQDYVDQMRQAMEFRLRLEPQNLAFAYTLSLATILERRVNAAIAALEHVVQLDPKNPTPYAYLAFVNLYDFRSHSAQIALDKALAIAPMLPELHGLKGIAALMQGNLIQAWNSAKMYQQLSAKT